MTSPALRGHKLVLIDTSLWIYHFENHPQFGSAASRIAEQLESGAFRGVASELTLLELLVLPLKLARQDIADEYELLLTHFPNFELVPVNREILLSAAGLRARYGLRTPDSIQLATGLHYGATAFVTNDIAWKKLDLGKIVMLSDQME